MTTFSLLVPDASQTSALAIAIARWASGQQVCVAGQLRVESGQHPLHNIAMSGQVAARQQLLRNTP